jgi:hypothetical protein
LASLGLALGLLLHDWGRLLNVDIAPESVAELAPVRGGKTPVRNASAGLAGGSHQDREASLLAWGNLGVASGALACRDELVDAGWVLRVHSTHVIPTDKLDTASRGPRVTAAVTEVPGLLEDGVGSEDSAVSDSITDEVSNQLFLDGRSRKLLGLLLDLGGLLGLGLGRLEIGYGLDLRRSICGRSGRRLGRLGHGAATAVAHDRHRLAILVIAHGGDRDVPDRGLELDEGVRFVVGVGRVGLAVGTEVRIVADGALVPVSGDVRLKAVGGIAERSIAIDAVVTGPADEWSALGGVGLVHRDKLVLRVDKAGVDETLRAVVPVWTVHTLVANTIDVLVTSVTDSTVAYVAARRKQGVGYDVKLRTLDGRSEGVLWIVAVLQGDVARDAEVVVLAGRAGDEVLVGPFCNGSSALSNPGDTKDTYLGCSSCRYG